jgi:Glycosyl transferase family 2
MKLAIAIPVCCRSLAEIRVGYTLESLALQQTYSSRFEIYLRDEGAVAAFSDRSVRLIIDLLSERGHLLNYLRRSRSNGIAVARRDLVEQILDRHDRILMVDDDMVLLPDAVQQLLNAAETAGEYGFIQGTKLELDPQREYMNDINTLNQRVNGGLRRIYFGDAAFLLVRRDALARVRWDIVSRFQEQNMAGEDVAFSLMIADQLPCYGATEAIGYHMPLDRPRWTWEPSSDALQLELLRGVVSNETLRLALPHMNRYIDGER